MNKNKHKGIHTVVKRYDQGWTGSSHDSKNNYTITKQIQSNLQGIVINMLSRVHGPVPIFGMAESISTGVFDKKLESCIDKTSTKLDDNFKAFSTLTVSKG